MTFIHISSYASSRFGGELPEYSTEPVESDPAPDLVHWLLFHNPHDYNYYY